MLGVDQIELHMLHVKFDLGLIINIRFIFLSVLLAQDDTCCPTTPFPSSGSTSPLTACCAADKRGTTPLCGMYNFQASHYPGTHRKLLER